MQRDPFSFCKTRGKGDFEMACQRLFGSGVIDEDDRASILLPGKKKKNNQQPHFVYFHSMTDTCELQW